MIYAKAFFDLQLEFAHRITILSGLPLARALLDYTNLYIRFGLGRGFDPAHPTWREYLDRPAGRERTREWTYRFYLRRHGRHGCAGHPGDLRLLLLRSVE